MKKFKLYIILLTLLSILIIFFMYPLFNTVLQSFGYFPELGLETFTLNYYKEIFSKKIFWSSLKYTLIFSSISAFLSVFLGFLFSLLIYKNKISRIQELLLRLPIILPYIIAILISNLLLSQSGFIARIFYFLGLIKETRDFLPLVQDSYGFGIIFTYLWKGIPFVIMIMVTALRNIDQKLILVARNLGASNLYIFFKIILPMVQTSLITSFLMIFSFTFGGFEVPFLLGPTNPKALSTLAYHYYSSNDLNNRIYSTGINVISMSICLVLLIVYLYFFEKQKNFKLDKFIPKKNIIKLSYLIRILISGCIIFSFLPIFIWAFTTRWEFPLLLPHEIRFKNIVEILRSNIGITTILTSILVSILVTFFTIILSLFLVCTLSKKEIRYKKIWFSITWAPLFIPSVTIGMSLYSFMTKFSMQDTLIGVIIANIIPCLPYTIFILLPTYEALDKKYEDQGILLGESKINIFFKITLPMIGSSLRTASILVFIISFGEYVLTFLIGGGLVKTFSITLFPYIQNTNRTLSASYSLLYVLILVICICLIEKTYKKYFKT